MLCRVLFAHQEGNLKQSLEIWWHCSHRCYYKRALPIEGGISRCQSGSGLIDEMNMGAAWTAKGWMGWTKLLDSHSLRQESNTKRWWLAKEVSAERATRPIPTCQVLPFTDRSCTFCKEHFTSPPVCRHRCRQHHSSGEGPAQLKALCWEPKQLWQA